jgi:hypothetical protein
MFGYFDFAKAPLELLEHLLKREVFVFEEHADSPENFSKGASSLFNQL